MRTKEEMFQLILTIAEKDPENTRSWNEWFANK